MSNAVRYTRPEVQERIARDYVLGALCMAARRRCETLRLELPELDARIYRWSEDLQPMAYAVPELEPSAAVWAGIEAAINPEPTGAKPSLWNRLSFVRALAFTSSFLVVALAFVQLTQVTPPAVDYIAVLASSDGQPRFVATASETSKELKIRRFGEPLDDESDYQLWAVSKTDGETRSLGLVDPVELSQRTLGEADWRLIIDAQELLVSAEMTGGSPIGEPSEEIISRGLCVRLGTG